VIRPCLLAALLLLPLGAARADAPPKRADAPAEIDRAVQELAGFVRRELPDREGDSLTILPFLSDRGGRVVLGERLAAELELALAGAYRRTRVGAGGKRVFTLMGELQPYASRLRVLCRLLGPDGSQLAAARAELTMSGELAALASAPAGPDYTGQGLHGSEEESSLARDLDPLEPDDSPGGEAALTGGESPLVRYLSAGDIDRFRFYVSSGGTIRLEVDTALDAQLILYREGERVPFDVRGNTGGKSILFEARLAPGYYVAELLAFSPEVEGPYAIRLAPAAPAEDPFEPDDSPSEARPLSPGARQERTLAGGDADWVELAPAAPGFYSLYTSGLVVDTALALFRDGRVLVAADEDSGEQANAFLGFFLGPGRWLARVEGKPPLADGPYTLIFERLEPEQIVPRPAARQLPLGERPLFLQLRVLKSGRYRVRCPGVELELYGLPGMKRLPVDGPSPLSAGDYLLVLKGTAGERASLSVAEE
jgi:hypothetical protein